MSPAPRDLEQPADAADLDISGGDVGGDGGIGRHCEHQVDTTGAGEEAAIREISGDCDHIAHLGGIDGDAVEIGAGGAL